jgi:hypothetical protein
MDLNRLKRFDKAKHEQLEQLVAWCQMMGLEGKDLVSIGGHLDRAKKSAEAKSNRVRAQEIKFDPVGADKAMSDKWSLKTLTGRYTFEGHSWQRVIVTSNKTKVRKTFDMEWYEIGRVSWRDRNRLQCALNIIHGEIKLDF